MRSSTIGVTKIQSLILIIVIYLLIKTKMCTPLNNVNNENDKDNNHNNNNNLDLFDNYLNSNVKLRHDHKLNRKRSSFSDALSTTSSLLLPSLSSTSASQSDETNRSSLERDNHNNTIKHIKHQQHRNGRRRNINKSVEEALIALHQMYSGHSKKKKSKRLSHSINPQYQTLSHHQQLHPNHHRHHRQEKEDLLNFAAPQNQSNHFYYPNDPEPSHQHQRRHSSNNNNIFSNYNRFSETSNEHSKSVSRRNFFANSNENEENQNVNLAKRHQFQDYQGDQGNDGIQGQYSNNNNPGDLTRDKFEQLGNRASVDSAFKQFKNSKEQFQAHIDRVHHLTCNIPKLRLIEVKGDSSKKYHPICTALHRCSDDAGCCQSSAKTCVAKTWNNVDLYFEVHKTTMSNHIVKTYEKITFQNHTKCHCVNRNSLSTINQSVESVVFDTSTPTSVGADMVAVSALGILPPTTTISPFAFRQTTRALNRRLNCTQSFTRIEDGDGNFHCDCISGNQHCEAIKKGQEHLSLNDRRCISLGISRAPTCEFGAFIKETGNCPTLESHIADTRNTLRNFN